MFILLDDFVQFEYFIIFFEIRKPMFVSIYKIE